MTTEAWTDTEIKKFVNRERKLILIGMTDMEAEKLAEKKAYDAARYAANKEAVKARVAKHRAANRDKANARNAAYYAAKSEAKRAERAIWRAGADVRAKAYDAARYTANAKVSNAKSTAWRMANLERSKLSNKVWWAANTERSAIYQNNRRARKLASGGLLSKDLRAKLFALQKGKCPCCRENLGARYHLDHIMPLALGGSNTDDNMQLLRQRCNNQKQAKPPIEFMQSRGFLL